MSKIHKQRCLFIYLFTGLNYELKRLKKNALPTVFAWNTQSVSKQAEKRAERLQSRNLKKSLFQEQLSTDSSIPQNEDIVAFENTPDIQEEVEIKAVLSQLNVQCSPQKKFHNVGTQTSNMLRMLSTEILCADDESVLYYTGLESMSKFNLVLSTLLPMAHNLQYRWSRVVGLSIEDQFLMLLMKLRRNKPDFELSKIFTVSKTEVSNIIVTWINFVSDLWSLIDTWPSKDLVKFYMPDSFRLNFNSTRLIIDGTEIPIQKPSQPDAQRATFSSYKHKNTLKFLVGTSPGGLLTFCSEAYAGSTSDRQVVERSNLFELCEKGDSIMADRGFNVQDLFAAKGVGINIPTFLKGKSQIPGLLLKEDQKLASQRVHIERLIGLTKTFKILTTELNQFYVPLASKIFKICVMLCNFREGIVNKNK